MIIFLHGADSFRSHRMLLEMKKKFISDTDHDSNSLSLLDGQATTLKEIGEKINTGSLFVKKRMVIIENIFKNKKTKIFTELADYLKKFSDSEDNIIIFIDEEVGGKNKVLKVDAKKLFTFLNKQKYVQEFPPLSNIQLLSFIKKEASTYNKEMAANAAASLINLANGDLWIMSSEIKKLSFHTSAKIISDSDVQELCAGAINDNIFALTDALSAKNKNLALKLLEEQYAAGLSDEYLIAMLIRQFKILLQIRTAIDSNLSQTEMASQLKLHPFVVKKGLFQAKNFSATNLKNYLNQLIRLDFSNKNGLSQIKTELMLLISTL
ncbi:MAG: DNA polymerase III subunit delta [Candidatus Falkowbacteria bacterium]